MNLHPQIDCFFVEPDTTPGESATWIEGNTIHVRDPLFQRVKDGLLHKTIAALEILLPSYTHFIRTNLNTVFDLNVVNDYMETHHQSMYTGSAEGCQFFIGYGIIFTKDVAEHIVKQYRLHEGTSVVDHSRPDDMMLYNLATGVRDDNRLDKNLICCPSLKSGTAQFMCNKNTFTFKLQRFYMTKHVLRLPNNIEFEKAKHIRDCLESFMIYRVKRFYFGHDLVKIATYYQYLLQKIYSIDTEDYLIHFAENLAQS